MLESGLLHLPLRGGEHQEVSIRFGEDVPAHRQDRDHILILTETLQQVAHVAAAGVAARFRRLPCTQSVDTPLVGEDEQPVLGEAGDDALREVILLGGHTLQSLAGAVLQTEGVRGDMPDVVLLRERDDDRLLLDEVLAVHRQRHRLDVAAPSIAVLVRHRLQFVHDDVEDILAALENLLVALDRLAQFVLFRFEFADRLLGEPAQRHVVDGSGLHL